MTGIDLSQLNESERGVLLLLAEGHTAKSIAILTGRSVGAVNERLREARRKTGVGSSRELARLVAQENRDEKIGMAGAEMDLPPDEVPGAGQRGRLARKGLLVMLPIAIAAAALLSMQNHVPPSDPDVDTIIGPTGDAPRDFRDRFRAESRDDAWASRTEHAARARYAAIPGLVHDASLRVDCAATICQVIGRSVPTSSDAEQNRVIASLQNGSLTADFAALGLQSKAMAFNSTGTRRAPSFAFVVYWVRKP